MNRCERSVNAPAIGDPCLDLPDQLPLPDGERVRVVQLVATGTNGGAQEHVATLLARIDQSRYDVRVISLVRWQRGQAAGARWASGGGHRDGHR